MTNKIKTTKLINAFNRVEKDASVIQTEMIVLFVQLVEMSKKEVVTSTALYEIFSHSMKGLDRNRLISWVEEFTPIRIKTKNNGHFEKVSWSNAYVKACKEIEVPVWNIAGMEASHWFLFEKATTKKASAPNVQAALDKLILELAKESYEKGSVHNTLNAFARNTKDIQTDVLGKIQSEKFSEWAAARAPIVEQQKREAAQLEKQQSAEVLQLINEARDLNGTSKLKAA
jgi:hypothetical protein